MLLAGAILVPIYPPARPDRIEEYLRRQAKILENGQIPLLVTFPEARLCDLTYNIIAENC